MMARRLVLIVLLVVLISCTSEEIPTFSTQPEGLWELMETKNAYSNWTAVSSANKHYLNFLPNGQFTFQSGYESCTGTYKAEPVESVESKFKITLQSPCMVPASQMFWEYYILDMEEDEVIVIPRLIPTAMLSHEQYKYRIASHHKTNEH